MPEDGSCGASPTPFGQLPDPGFPKHHAGPVDATQAGPWTLAMTRSCPHARHVNHAMRTSHTWSTSIASEPPPRAHGSSRPRAEVVLLWLQALLAVGAYAGAIGFITGGIDIGDAAADLPFGSLVFAGIALGLVNGVLPTIVLIGGLRRHRWARVGHLVVGLVLVGWIVTQVIVLGPPIHVLQAAYFAWGWLMAALAVRLLQQRT